MRFFETHIRPLLIEKCFECHSGDESEGGLRLDLNDSLTKGGSSGQAVVAGKPDESLLVSAIRYEDLEMPPDDPLSKQEQAVIEKWVADGAYWPITASASSEATQSEDWWAAQPIDPGVVPDATNVHSKSVIDRYVDDRLNQDGLHRAPPADRTRLIRRLSFDLLGLPPSPEAIDNFVADRRSDAYERLVDRMFADPAYGERMARLWLDLVRYSESDGWRQDAYRPQAWRYRQFVADAFNQSMPYDQFVQWQLAGDELAPGNDQARAAVGFLRLGIYEYNQRDAEGQWQNIVDEMTDVTADVFLATGLACAKCHDHKFDPIPRADYFRVRSVFEPVLFVDQSSSDTSRSPEQKAKIDALLTELDEIEGKAVKELGDYSVSRFPLHIQAMYHKPKEQRNSYEDQMAYMVARQIIDEGLQESKIAGKIGKEKAARRKEIIGELNKLNANPWEPAAFHTITDTPGEIRKTRFPGRTQGSDFRPAVPQIFGGQTLQGQPPLESPQSTGRRTALAQWIVSRDNPITPRVMVNRLWQYHFGTGLVASPNDFGRLGTPPSHPGLLDHLAQRFLDTGWDIQAIQREILLSATYRQSVTHPQADAAMRVDASNRLLWHHRVRRLDAEQYRDALLVAMDSLQDQFGGPSVPGTPGRRSLYLQRKRNSSDEMLRLLDAPPGIVGTAKRDVTVTAPQSLMMLNNSRFISVAKSFAQRVSRDIAELPQSDHAEAFVRRAMRIVSGHCDDEQSIGLLSELAATGKQGEIDVCHVLLNSNAFLFVE
ncbi:MAG: DUF1549 domain-containing protein [Pirellulaceae bacterium]|nr:DUF1549 domain-containing protein [Pirellulaceae bacterium]